MDTRNPVLGRMTENSGAGFAYDEGRRAFEQASGRTANPSTSPTPSASTSSTSTSSTSMPSGATDETASLHELYNAPERARVGERMTIDDVVAKTAILFGVLLAGAFVGWALPALALPAALVGLVLGLTNAVKKKVSPALVVAYALAQGVFLGGISVIFTAIAGGQPIVHQAIIGTLVAFGVMLWLYSTERVRVTGKFVKVMMGLMISYLLIAVASVVASFMGVGSGWGFYGVQGIGLLLCLAGVGLASFSLMLDFESIKQAIAYGVPRQEAWRASFGLMVTLIWLYTEILRLLAILNSDE